MKKVFLIVLFITCWTGCFAQHVWHSQDYEDAQKIFDEVERNYKRKGNKTWSKKLLEAFPVAEDKTIKHQCVVKSDSTFDIKVISHVLSAWCKIKYPEAVPDSVSSHEHLRISGTLKGVGQTMGAAGTYINAREEVMIDIKDNRVRVTSRIFNYITGTWKGAEHNVPGDCFPVNLEASKKDSHAMAFINCHYNSLLTISSLIKYLNDNVSSIKNNDDDW